MGLIGDFQKGRNVHRTIEDMLVGEKGYIVPWALAVDDNMQPYLYLRAVINKKPIDEAAIQIVRTGAGRNDYEVDVRNANYKWEITISPEQGWGGFDASKIVALEVTPQPTDAKDVEKAGRIARLRKQLASAIEKEDFRTAGYLRDKIRDLKNN